MAKIAVPLVLPNNCAWNAKTGVYRKIKDKDRTTLQAVPEALEMLGKIKGPVCVVAIAGPCRKGKSYILSELFEQGEVFPVGHTFDSETMGIWLWVVQKRFRDSSGQTFTVVLMDTEGIDAVSAEKTDDHKIFTLSLLLASVLLYNSVGVPTRTDLEGLDYIAKLSQRIQLHTGQCKEKESRQIFEVFPYFVWLLRDVLLQLPPDCETIKDYFLKRVFRATTKEPADKAQQVADSILKYFPGFDAFALPVPSSDPDVVAQLSNASVKEKVNKAFLEQVKVLKRIVKRKLAPKSYFEKGEFVTGEALATLVPLYCQALNTPGTVPNVQSAWDSFVHTKRTKAKTAALQLYEEMTSHAFRALPCDVDIIRKTHLTAHRHCLEFFRDETFGISSQNVKACLEELGDKTGKIFLKCKEENNRRTEEACKDLIRKLEKKHMDPIISRLSKSDHGGVQFHEELKRKMNFYIRYLQRLEDFDEELVMRKIEKAQEEKNRRKIEEEKARLKAREKSMELKLEVMQNKREEDVRRLERMMQVQREQIENIAKANIKSVREERQATIEAKDKQIQALKDLLRLRHGLSPKRSLESRPCSYLQQCVLTAVIATKLHSLFMLWFQF